MLVSVFFLFQLLINENCRKRSKHIAFYTIDCKDSCGEIFVDLQKHSYVQVCCALEHD
jgi:ubiquitin-like 1-activating enzyme E1 A